MGFIRPLTLAVEITPTWCAHEYGLDDLVEVIDQSNQTKKQQQDTPNVTSSVQRRDRHGGRQIRFYSPSSFSSSSCLH